MPLCSGLLPDCETDPVPPTYVVLWSYGGHPGTNDDTVRTWTAPANGVAVITAAISPYADIRDQNRALIGDGFVEVYAQCSIEELTRRDVKGLYEKALRGEIQNFTGISDPYEAPEHAEVIVDTEKENEAESLAKILAHLEAAGVEQRLHGGCALGQHVRAVAGDEGARQHRHGERDQNAMSLAHGVNPPVTHIARSCVHSRSPCSKPSS